MVYYDIMLEMFSLDPHCISLGCFIVTVTSPITVAKFWLKIPLYSF